MATAGAHYRTRYKAELSPRQREVLELVARGYTNGQIAERLGMTLDGAKWHVSEILAKLGVDTREEAARYWRAERSLTRRIARALPAMSIAGWRTLAIAGAGSAVAAAAVLVAVTVWVSANNGHSNAPVVPISSRTATPSAQTASPRATVAQEAASTVTTAVPSATSVSGPASIGTAVSNPSIQSFHMMSSSVGWAIEASPSHSAVLRTTDGGTHWRSVLAEDAPIGPAYFLSDQDGWIGVVSSPPGGGSVSVTIWGTTDGGATWRHGDALTGGAPEGSLTFIDATHGWFLQSLGAGAGSEGVTLYRTTNGGATWIRLWSTPPGPSGALPLGCMKTGLTFVGPNRGWATGQCNGGAPFLYTTTDGGATWQQVNLLSSRTPGYPLTQCLCAFEPPAFQDAQRGFMPAVVDAEHVVYVTSDGGATWIPTGGVPEKNGLMIYSFADATHGWAATNANANLYVTTDGGTTWRLLATPAAFVGGVGALQFTDSLHGWATAWGTGTNPQSSLFRTSDGGLTWSAASE